MGISPESSISLTWFANTTVNILIGVESAGSGFASFLDCRGEIMSAGWYALTSFRVEKYDLHPKAFLPKIVWCNI